jgi:predicted RecA/RadA family phage recombinase
MSKASFWQRGETLDYKNETTVMIEAGTIIAVGEILGVTGMNIDPGDIGSLHVSGVFEMPKGNKEELVMGKKVYFDGTKITATEADVTAGWVAAPAASTDAVVLVKLIG